MTTGGDGPRAPCKASKPPGPLALAAARPFRLLPVVRAARGPKRGASALRTMLLPNILLTGQARGGEALGGGAGQGRRVPWGVGHPKGCRSVFCFEASGGPCEVAVVGASRSVPPTVAGGGVGGGEC